MAIITLTTDFGSKDYYVAAVKGYIHSQVPSVQVIDISHAIAPFNISEAAFILRNSYQNFPAHSIHIISVESDSETNSEYVLVQYKNQYLISKNNGVISLITDGKADKIIKLHVQSEEDHLFPVKNIMAKAACGLARKTSEYELGTLVKELKTVTSLNPMLEPNIIRGTIIYIDNFGNAITNISKSHFERYDESLKPTIQISPRQKATKIDKLYSDVPEGELVCLFGNTGLLEVAINKGNAGQLLSLQAKGKIFIEFD